MTTPSVRLSFFKLNTPDMARALQFYTDAFGFAVIMTFDEPDFLEHMLALPGQEQGPNLLLVTYKTGRSVLVGQGHGPVGLVTDEIDALCARATAAGATVTLPVFETDGVKVCMMLDPDGHEIELVQLPG